MPGKGVIVVDLGATQLRLALVREGQILNRLPLGTSDGSTNPNQLLYRIATGIRRQLDLTRDDVLGVGVVFPGPTNGLEGVVYRLPNVPGWEQEVNVVEILRGLLPDGLPIFIENDAAAGALGEHYFGAGHGVDEMTYITLSSGVGGGVISAGKLFRGFRGSAAEIGHMIIDRHSNQRCNCGNLGDLESLVSGTAIARMGKEAVERGQSVYFQQILARGGVLDAKTFADAAREGNSIAVYLYDQMGEALGIGFINIAHAYNPSMFVLGGGVSKSSDLFLPKAEQILKQALPANRNVLIEFAQLGDDVGLFGAAALVYQELGISNQITV